jgi:DNA (cytosine-5)-methyltransferase 1
VGNAVPPLLGAALGAHLTKHAGEGGVVDLFAGAGGLSLGLELAGCPVVAAVEYDANIGATYQANRPCEVEPEPGSGKTLFLLKDLSRKDEQDEVIRAVRAKVEGREVGAVFGGPPCQGFSHAGWRSSGDSRNTLAGAFLRIVEELKPRLVVLENVEGLLTFNKGKTIGDITRVFRELGYQVGAQPWVLCAEQYGVPQMRRRVFVVGVREGPVPPPPPPVFAQCRGRRERAEDLSLFRELPYPITVAEALDGLPPLMRRRRDKASLNGQRPAYGRWLKGCGPLADALSGK